MLVRNSMVTIFNTYVVNVRSQHLTQVLVKFGIQLLIFFFFFIEALAYTANLEEEVDSSLVGVAVRRAIRLALMT